MKPVLRIPSSPRPRQLNIGRIAKLAWLALPLGAFLIGQSLTVPAPSPRVTLERVGVSAYGPAASTSASLDAHLLDDGMFRNSASTDASVTGPYPEETDMGVRCTADVEYTFPAAGSAVGHTAENHATANYVDFAYANPWAEYYLVGQ